MPVKIKNILFVFSMGKMTIAVNWTKHPNNLVNKAQIVFGKRTIERTTFKNPTLKNTKNFLKQHASEINAQYDNNFNEINQSNKRRDMNHD